MPMSDLIHSTVYESLIVLSFDISIFSHGISYILSVQVTEFVNSVCPLYLAI